METREGSTPEAGQGLPGAGNGLAAPVAAAPHVGGKKCPCDKCTEERRAKWRARDLLRRRRDNPFARTRGEADDEGRSKVAELPGLAGESRPADPPRPFIPWTVDLVRPLVSRAADLLERWDGQSLIAEARKVGPRVAEFIASRVAWNAEAKGMLVDGGAETAVKYLNEAKISAEYLPELKLGLAALSILYSRQAVVEELRKQAAEEAARKASAGEERKAA